MQCIPFSGLYEVTQSLGHEEVRHFVYGDVEDKHARHVQQQLCEHFVFHHTACSLSRPMLLAAKLMSKYSLRSLFLGFRVTNLHVSVLVDHS